MDPRLEREVALKLLRTDRSAPAPAAVREAWLLARVRHPNVVTAWRVVSSWRSGSVEPTTRRIAVVDWPFAKVSPDGRLLLYQESESRHLWVKDLTTGTVRALIQEPATVTFAWSPDSRQIAFATIDGGNVRLQTAGVTGDGRRVVWAGKRGGHPVPIDWTPDGRHLLCDTWPGGTRQLALLAIADGSLRAIAAIPAQADAARVSPDGRFAAYAASRGCRYRCSAAGNPRRSPSRSPARGRFLNGRPTGGRSRTPIASV